MASSATGRSAVSELMVQGMSLVEELKRRKVFKVAAAYLVVAWLAVQAASIGFPTFDAPIWALRIFILMAMLGFPIVLLLSWVLDLTPEGMRFDPSTSGNTRIFAIVAILVAMSPLRNEG